MIIRRAALSATETTNCHGGMGLLACVEMLKDYSKKNSGFKYFHDNVLAPGASIGAHAHQGDEEIYLFVDGEGEMTMDGKAVPVTAGDLCLTQSGHSHGLTNTGNRPMHFYVICANL